MVPHIMDEVEGDTYFSKQTLSNAIGASEFRARAATAGNKPERVMKVVADYFDSREAVRSAEILVGDVEEALLDRIDPEWFDSGKIEDTIAAIPELAGAVPTNDGTSLFIRGKKLHVLDVRRGKVTMLDGMEAGKRFHELCRTEVRTKSTAEMRLFNIVRDADAGYLIDFPEMSVSVNVDEYKTLRSGVPLPENHPFSQGMKASANQAHVVYSNVLMRKVGPESAAADEFAFAVQRAYPLQRIYRDPLSPRTAQLVELLNAHVVKRMDAVNAIIAGQSFRGVDDGKVMAILRQELIQAGVNVIEFNGADGAHWLGAKGQTMIVITGHSDPELAGFVKALGEAGYLDGNYVVFNSCGTPLTRSLVDLINGRYKATGTFTYEGKISAANVENMLSELASKLKLHCQDFLKQAGPPKFVDLLRETVQKFKLNGVWVICMAERQKGAVSDA
ncbi:MAG: hypothetical protein JWN24_2475 [Phycisphaerales bacterium]|nr:hypothetical protein [Phycisphaerales bacterium]